MHRNLRKGERSAAFTLVEVVIAIAILLVSFGILINLQGTAVSRSIHDRNELSALLLGRALLAGVESNVLSVEDGKRTEPAMEFAKELGLVEEGAEKDSSDLSKLTVTWDVVPVDLPTQTEALNRILLSIAWGELPGDRLELVYFAPRENEPET